MKSGEINREVALITTREYAVRLVQLTNNKKRLEAKWAFVEKEKKKIAREKEEANELVDEKERRAIEVDKQTNEKQFELYETEKKYTISALASTKTTNNTTNTTINRQK